MNDWNETLTAAAAIVLSLAFLYIPGLRERFARLDDNGKRRWMLLLLAVVTAAIYGLSCAGLADGLFGKSVACDQAGLLGLARAFGIAVIANQATHRIAPKTAAPKTAAPQ